MRTLGDEGAFDAVLMQVRSRTEAYWRRNDMRTLDHHPACGRCGDLSEPGTVRCHCGAILFPTVNTLALAKGTP